MQKSLKQKDSYAEGKNDYKPLKIVFPSQSNPQNQELASSPEGKSQTDLREVLPKSIFFRYSGSIRILLAVILISVIIYIQYEAHSSSSSLQQKINDRDQQSILDQEQFKKIEENLNERKISMNDLVGRDKDSIKIEDSKTKKEIKEDLLMIPSNNQLLSKDALTTKNGEFIINPQVWMLQKKGSCYLEKLMVANNKRFASLSNFRVNSIDKSNYQAYLSQEGNEKIQTTLKTLKERMDNGDKSLKIYFNSIEKRLILFSILHERGGIIIDSVFTLTENFDWIRQIQSNIYVNRGNPGAQPEVVGFYSPFFSSDMRKQNKSLSAGMEEVQKYMVLIPAMQNFFVAAKEGAEFIGRILDEMILILMFPKLVLKDIEENKYEYFNLNGKDIYNQYFLLAGLRLLEAKQLELDNKNINPNFRNFAIDYYGLFLINNQYGPYKLSLIFQYLTPERKIQNMAKYDLEEYYASVGPIRYLQMPTFFKDLNIFLTRIRNNKLEKQIMKGSYLQQMYFPEATEPFVYNNPQKWVANQTALPWDSLAKIIWVYWDTGIANAGVQVFLCFQNLKRTSFSSGFEVKEVNNNNLKDYLDSTTIEKIEFTLKNAKITTFRQTKSDLIRLALLHKYGGIYLDASVIAVENFDWLVNIAKFPSQYIFNRYGEVPSVLMFWNPNAGGFLEWEVDQIVNTKEGWRYSFENSIIVAVKQSEFIKEWFNLLLQLLMKTTSEVLEVFQQCNISSFKWTHQNSQYLLSMDTAKCVIGRRQVWITNQHRTEWKNAMAYYKLWSMSTFFGPFKIRFNTNYANIKRAGNNPFMTRYSQEYVEGITGKMHFMLKFITGTRQMILNFIQENFDRLREETHSQSLFMKYLYDAKQGRFEKTGNIIKFVKIHK